MTEESLRSVTLTSIVEVLAATDPDRAERIAQSFSDVNRRWEALPASRG